MYAILMVTFTINIPPMLASVYHTYGSVMGFVSVLIAQPGQQAHLGAKFKIPLSYFMKYWLVYTDSPFLDYYNPQYTG